MSSGSHVASRTSSLFLLHSFAASDSASSAGGSSLELISSQSGASAATIPVSSTVKGAGSSHATGRDRVDLVTVFAGGAYAACTFKEANNNRLVVYALATAQKQNQSTLPERARALLVDPLSRYLIVGSVTGRMRIYSLATGSLLTPDLRTHHDRGINVLAMDRAARWLAVGGQDGIISVYDFAALLCAASMTGLARSQAQSGALALSISDHTQPITSLHITASGRLLTGSKDGSVRFYALDQPVVADSAGLQTSSAGGASSSVPAPTCLFHSVFRGHVNAVTMDAAESIAYVACNELIHWLPLYPTRFPASASTGWFGHGASIRSLSLDASGTRLLSVDAEGTAKLWEAGGLSPFSLPPAQGTCLKTLAKRPGCEAVHWVGDVASSASGGRGPGAARVATIHTHATQHAAPARGGSGLVTRESGWIFPPLNSSAVAAASSQSTVTANAAHGTIQGKDGLLFIPLQLTQSHGALNSELRGGLVRDALVRPNARKRRWADAAMYQVQGFHGGHAAHAYSSSSLLSADLSLLTGSSGWSSLASSTSAQVSLLDSVRARGEMYERQCAELYALAVEKVWKDVRATAENDAGEEKNEPPQAQRRKR